MAENRRGGKKSPWRKKIAMAEKIAVAEDRHGGKISPWRKISVAENFFCIRPSSVSTLFILFEKRIRYGSEITRAVLCKLKFGKNFRKISVKNSGKNFGKNFGKNSGKIFEKNFVSNSKFLKLILKIKIEVLWRSKNCVA